MAPAEPSPSSTTSSFSIPEDIATLTDNESPISVNPEAWSNTFWDTLPLHKSEWRLTSLEQCQPARLAVEQAHEDLLVGAPFILPN